MPTARYIKPYIDHGFKSGKVRKITVSIPAHVLRLLSDERTRRHVSSLRHATNSELLCEAFLHAFTGQPLPTDEELRPTMATKKAAKKAIKKPAKKAAKKPAKKAAKKTVRKSAKAKTATARKTAAKKTTRKTAAKKTTRKTAAKKTAKKAVRKTAKKAAAKKPARKRAAKKK